MRYSPASSELFIRNRNRLAALLKPSSLTILNANDIMPTNADGTAPFKQNTDLYYLCGIDQEETVLLIFPHALHELDREILFIRETNHHIAIWEGHKLNKDEASHISGVKNVQWLSTLEPTMHRLIQQSDNIYLNSNEHARANSPVETRDTRFAKELKNLYPLHQYQRLAPHMHGLRTVKQPEEIKMLQKACDITEAGFRRVLSFVKPNTGEWEIEAEFIHEFTRQKSKGFAYQPIIGSGKNACILHYLDNNQLCKDGDLILMDVAAEYGNWNADMTRTIPVNGKFSPRQRDVYNSVLRVMHQCNQILRPGILHTDYQKKVLSFMNEELISLGLIDKEEATNQNDDMPLVKKYFMHGASHHLGLDVHDVCVPHMPFAEGMVFTIEPGIYIPEENIGIRLENNYLIGKDKNIDLMKNIPIEVEDIEKLMNK